MTVKQVALPKTSKLISTLTETSVKNYYNPYQEFVWTGTIPEDQYWMSPELLSVYGTKYMNKLNEMQLIRLSKWECVNFFSLNVNGEREVLQIVIQYLHQPGFEDWSEYLHHFIGEENEHLWFFSQFCLKYGKKIYKDKSLKRSQFVEADIEQFLNFARILIFENIGDFYNVRMQNDERLPPIIRQISRVHHQDESRHLVMGREIVKGLFIALKQKYDLERLQEIACYLKVYTERSIESFYNPIVYQDAGLEKPYELRRELLRDAFRESFHNQMLVRTLCFLTID